MSCRDVPCPISPSHLGMSHQVPSQTFHQSPWWNPTKIQLGWVKSCWMPLLFMSWIPLNPHDLWIFMDIIRKYTICWPWNIPLNPIMKFHSWILVKSLKFTRPLTGLYRLWALPPGPSASAQPVTGWKGSKCRKITGSLLLAILFSLLDVHDISDFFSGKFSKTCRACRKLHGLQIRWLDYGWCKRFLLQKSHGSHHLTFGSSPIDLFWPLGTPFFQLAMLPKTLVPPPLAWDPFHWGLGNQMPGRGDWSCPQNSPFGAPKWINTVENSKWSTRKIGKPMKITDWNMIETQSRIDKILWTSKWRLATLEENMM